MDGSLSPLLPAARSKITLPSIYSLSARRKGCCKAMGRAEDLFSRIKIGGHAEIDAMVAAGTVEELFLDYKLAATGPPFNRLDPSDRKNLSKAIAGFANSEGGVI